MSMILSLPAMILPHTALADSVTNTISTPGSPWRAAFDPNNGKIYVTEPNSNTVAEVDGSTNSISGTISVSSPFAIAFNPIDSKIYVTNYVQSTLTVIDPSTNTITATIPISTTGFVGPNTITINSANGEVYVGTVEGAVYAINPVSRVIDATIHMPGSTGVGGMAFDLSNGKIYATLPQNMPGDQVVVIDSSTNTIVHNILVDPAPFEVTVNSNNGLIYVASEHAAVDIISDTTNTVVGRITPPVAPHPLSPHGITFNPDNGNIYVTGITGYLPGDYVFIIDGSSNTVIGSPIPVGGTAEDIVYDTLNNNMYVPNWSSNNVSVISTTSQVTQGAVCPEKNIQHWDKIVFEIKSPELAKKVNLTANTELDIKVRDDPTKVSDIKEKVLDFLHVPHTPAANITGQQRSMVQLLNVGYAIICAATSGPMTSGTTPSMTATTPMIHAQMSTIKPPPPPPSSSSAPSTTYKPLK